MTHPQPRLRLRRLLSSEPPLPQSLLPMHQNLQNYPDASLPCRGGAHPIRRTYNFLAPYLTGTMFRQYIEQRMELSDPEAAQQARNGDPNAFRVLVNRHGRTLFRVVFRMVGNKQDAEDVVQEAFLRAFKQIHQFDGGLPSDMGRRIAINCSLDLLRSRNRRKEQSVPLADEEAENPLDRVAVDQPSPERLTHSTQIAGMLEVALGRLTEMERCAFVLRHYEDCGIDEIARTLGVGESAAKHCVYRAVAKLRQALLPVWGFAR